MFLILFLLFTAVPAFELYLLIEVGSQIGVLETIWIVIITGVIGAALAKSQGRQFLQDTRAELSQGNMPAQKAVEGLLIFVGGILLITPGFVTDFLGLSFVFPVTRKLIAMAVSAYFKKLIAQGKVNVMSNGGFSSGGANSGFYYTTYTSSSSQGGFERPSEMRDVTPNDPEKLDGK